MKKILLLLFFLSQVYLYSQPEFFPGDLNIQPFTANFLEPKLGFLFQLNENELRLDIGNSLDILRYRTTDGAKLSLGADLFTYTLLRGEKDFHFPVDAVDYLFGINFGYKKEEADYEYGARFRISHISAHFVDGHFDNLNKEWKEGLAPKVYSREFLEFIPYYRRFDIRIYAGFTYLYHVDPAHIGKSNYQFGFDYFIKDFPVEFIHPFIGYDLRLVKLNKYTGNNNFTAGVKFGFSNSRGVSLYYSYYSGKNIHGEYFFQESEYSAFGVNLDL